MLGYGGTDKPAAASEYSMKKLCADLAALLDAIGVQRVVSPPGTTRRPDFRPARFLNSDPRGPRLGRLHRFSIRALAARQAASSGNVRYTLVILKYEHRSSDEGQIVGTVRASGPAIPPPRRRGETRAQLRVPALLRERRGDARDRGRAGAVHAAHVWARAPAQAVHGQRKPQGVHRERRGGHADEQSAARRQGERRAFCLRASPSKRRPQEIEYYAAQFKSMHGPLSYYRTTKIRFEEEHGD